MFQYRMRHNYNMYYYKSDMYYMNSMMYYTIDMCHSFGNFGKCKYCSYHITYINSHELHCKHTL